MKDDKLDHQKLQDLNKWLRKKSRHLSRESEEEKKAERDGQNLDNVAKHLQNEQLSENIKTHQQDRKLREKYADKIFEYLKGYTIGVFVILGIHGWFSVFGDWVLVALIGSIATGVFTSVNAVMKGLFGSEKN